MHLIDPHREASSLAVPLAPERGWPVGRTICAMIGAILVPAGVLLVVVPIRCRAREDECRRRQPA
jgi:hypothetical protein